MDQPTGEYDRYRVAVVRNCTLSLVGVGAVMCYRAFLDGYPSVVGVVLCAMALGLGILVRLHRGASHTWAGATGICILYSIIVLANFTTGGFGGSNFGWFAIIPVAAALLVGTRAAVGWGAAVVVASLFFYWLHRTGIEVPHWIAEPDRASFDLFNRISQTATLVVLAAAFVRGHMRVGHALVTANRALTRETVRVQLLQYAAMSANEAETVEDAVTNCARRVTRVTGWPLAMHWAPDPETAAWHFERHWSVGPERFDEMVAQSEKLQFGPGELALGRVVETVRPLAASRHEIAADGSPRGVLALAAGLGSVVSIPVVSQGRAVSILEFWSNESTLIDASTMQVLGEVGHQLGRVAKRIQLEERVRRAQKLESVAQLAAGIAHEINNPMTYVRSNLGGLEAELCGLREVFEKPMDPAEVQQKFAECDELVAEAIEGADRTVAIVRDIRDFSRDGREPPATAELAQIADAALRLCGHRLTDSIEVVTDFAPGARVQCNTTQLQQVLVNLIVNGAQSMPDGGRLHIATEIAGDRVQVSVADEGRGIPPEVRERIFDPFFTTKTIGEGTGLGLYVSHGIVEAHHGEIVVESVRPQGTRFVVRLPVVAA
jgi:two-component system NtrC family sensor kinase